MFIPPTYVRIVSTKTDGLAVRHDFVIDDSELEKVAEALVRSLEQGIELFINDHRRNDSEGGLSLVKGIGAIRRMVGGHGYSSEWSDLNKADAIAEVVSTLAATMGGPQCGGGHFRTRREP